MPSIIHSFIHSFNQSINPSIHPSINQSINQSMTWYQWHHHHHLSPRIRYSARPAGHWRTWNRNVGRHASCYPQRQGGVRSRCVTTPQEACPCQQIHHPKMKSGENLGPITWSPEKKKNWNFRDFVISYCIFFNEHTLRFQAKDFVSAPTQCPCRRCLKMRGGFQEFC